MTLVPTLAASRVCTHPHRAQSLMQTVLFIQPSPVALVVKNPQANAGDLDAGSIGRKIPGQEDPLEKRMATHSSILAWRISWIEDPGGL